MSNRIGHLHGGHNKVAATASIPSKYQTIVVGNNEKKGFNSGSKRSFAWQKIDESPGPANYSLSTSILNENSASLSKKGLGGFVSKVKRLPVGKNGLSVRLITNRKSTRARMISTKQVAQAIFISLLRRRLMMQKSSRPRRQINII